MSWLILASGSKIRAELLRQANVNFQIKVPRVDEDLIKESLLGEGISPRDIADALAESKARKVAGQNPDNLVLGCDQVLEFEGALVSKAASPEDAMVLLKRMRGKRHSLFSAAVIYEGAKPVWRNVGQVRLHMREASDNFLSDYVERNWDSIKHAVGCYKLEEEGPRLFTRIEGDHFNVLGLPLLELLSYLTLRGTLES